MAFERYDSPDCITHIKRVVASYTALTGRSLFDLALADDVLAKQFFYAPFALVSHGTEADPIFNYGNQTALQLFGMDWQTFSRLPSRYSAEQANREARERILVEVSRNGYVDDYAAVRIAADGSRFRIKQATVWNVIGEHGEPAGQAAMFAHWQAL